MNKTTIKPKDVDSYIAQFPKEVQLILQKIRELVKQLLPEATESITYDIPTFKIGEHTIVYFGAWKSHIGFYALEPQDSDLHQEVEKYLAEKGTIKIPLDKEIPYDLISRLIEDKIKREKV